MARRKATEAVVTRRFESEAGHRPRFWELTVAGERLCVRHGVVGAEGTTSERTCASATEAAREAERRVREKVARGYREVSAGDLALALGPVGGDGDGGDDGIGLGHSLSPRELDAVRALFGARPQPSREEEDAGPRPEEPGAEPDGVRGPAPRGAWMSASGEDAHGPWAEARVAGETVRFRFAPPGTFLMGSPPDEVGRADNEGPQHEVELTRGFWLGETPVTAGQWQAVMGENPSECEPLDDSEGALHPVDNVSWDDCAAFLAAVNRAHPGLSLRLPTSAEWEYACRAGTTGLGWRKPSDPRLLMDHRTIGTFAWFELTTGYGTRPVACKDPNPWGLHDLLGNVWEWCSDFGGDYPATRQVDPAGPKKGPRRVIRGGCWNDPMELMRPAVRGSFSPDEPTRYFGLRLARTAD